MAPGGVRPDDRKRTVFPGLDSEAARLKAVSGLYVQGDGDLAPRLTGRAEGDRVLLRLERLFDLFRGVPKRSHLSVKADVHVRAQGRCRAQDESDNEGK